MHAHQVMSTRVTTVPADASVYEAARILLNSGDSAAPVVDADGSVVGIVSESDLLYRPERATQPVQTWMQHLISGNFSPGRDHIRSRAHCVADVMTRHVVTAYKASTLEEIAALMQRHRIKRVPIIEGRKIVGMVSRSNLLQGLLAARVPC